MTTDPITAAAKAIYDLDPYTESGEFIDGFQVSPGGALTWQQALERDAEFNGDITKFAFDAARAAIDAYEKAREPEIERLRADVMNDEQIKHMVNRFLSWRLPEDFRPDAGISFKADYNEHTSHPMKHEPTGTNLFDATQAEAMVRHMLEGAPSLDLRPLLRNFACFVHGLNCLGCKAQGRELAAKCCRDIDCDSGFYGIDADAIKQLLDAVEEVMPGTLAEIENPAEPINEASPPQEPKL